MELEGTFPENNNRVKRQKESPIRVVIANPPYSANQGDANNNNQNLKYPALDARIGETYAARSTATNKNSIYDSYVRAIRWASDRIEDRGVVGFVTNGYFIDGNAMDGLRACSGGRVPIRPRLQPARERKDERRTAQAGRRETSSARGARTPVAITLLVKNPAKKSKRVTSLLRHRRLPQPRRKARDHQRLRQHVGHRQGEEVDDACAERRPRLDQPTRSGVREVRTDWATERQTGYVSLRVILAADSKRTATTGATHSRRRR